MVGLGLETWGLRMVGAYKTTELNLFVYLFGLLVWSNTNR